jgi:hypothetical protein
MRVWILVGARELLVVVIEVVLVDVDVVDEAESEGGDVGNDSYTCAGCVCRWGCRGRFVVLLVVVEVIVTTVVVVVVADEVDGASCMRIEGELVDVEVDEQSNEALSSVTGEVGVRIVVRERWRGCSSSLDALRFFDVLVSCLVGWLSSSLPLSLPPLGVLSTTVV